VAGNELSVEIREATGKGVARKLRAAGKIPGICYGQKETQSITLDPEALDRLIRGSAAGMNTLIDLKVAGGGKFDGKKVLLKEMQRDPVNNNPLHADFFALDLTHKIEVAIPIHATGTAVGVTMGGILDQVLREVQVECEPDAIPEEIVVDVTALEVGMSVHVRDLPLPEGATLRSDGDLSVLSVMAPKVEEEPVVEEELTEEEAAAAAAAAEGEADESDASGDKGADGQSGD
jgi:large subunit ribosomal protein L25